MNRQVGACYTLCVAIVIFFAIVLKPDEPDAPQAKRTNDAAVSKSVEPARGPLVGSKPKPEQGTRAARR